MDKISHYHIKEKIGVGGMGVVFKAFDDVLEREVAVKLMHSHLLQDAQNIERFLREARAAAKLVHPNVVTIHEIGEAEKGRFIVMEYVQGIPLTQLLRNEGPLETRKAINLFLQLLDGLSCAHSLGILHRDIKSENILVTAQGALKILDFGIAKLTTQAGMTLAGDILGTVEYMPPEQMLGEPLDGRCDIYAAGTVLYQMLTNQMPFTGDIPVTLLYKKLNEDPPPLSRFKETINEELDHVVMKAIHRDREQRWETAEGFKQALMAVLNEQHHTTTVSRKDFFASGFEFPEPEPVELPPEESSRPVWVGREEEFRIMSRTLAEIKENNGQCLILKGEAGVGKTSLIQRFKTYAHRKHTWVLYGSCLYQEGLDAYLPFIDAIHEFFSEENYNLSVEDQPKIESVLAGKMPVLAELTTRFKVFQQNGQQQPPDNLGVNGNLFEGIFQLITYLARQKPVLLIIDDLHWADESTLRLFHYLSRHIAGHPVMLVGATRTDRYDLQKDGKPAMVVDVLSRMRQEGISRELNLEKLSRQNSIKLIDDTFGQSLFTDEFYQMIFAETKGNPFFIVETLKLLKEKQAVYLKEGIWYDKPDIQRIDVPHRVEDVFMRRLSALSEEEREILQVAAVIGNRFEDSLLTLILDLPRLKLLKIFQKIIRELQIISSTEEGFIFDHPMLREILYNEIPHALQREYHLIIAAEMEKQSGSGSRNITGELAEHWRRGGDYQRAMPLLFQAATRHFHLSACNEAAVYFEHLLESQEKSGLALPDDISLNDIYLPLGICYEEIGRWQNSIDMFKKLKEFSEEQSEIRGQADALRRIGRLQLKLGNWDSALSSFQECLRLVQNHRIPNMMSRIYNNMGVIHFQRGNNKEALKHFEMTLNYADKDNGDYDVAHALTNMGIIHNIEENHAGAMESYQKALEIYRKKEDRQSQAKVYHNIGMTYSDLEKWDDSIKAYLQCFEMANEIEDKQLIALTNLNLGKTYLRQGDFVLAKDYSDKALRFFKRVYDVLSVAEVYLIYGRICAEKEDNQKAEKFFQESIKINRDKEFLEGLAEVCETYADYLSGQGRIAEAEEYYREALRSLEKMQLPVKVQAVNNKIEELKLMDLTGQEAVHAVR
ncbi:MAG: tetratricopeptide repeat protein [Calditrichia bacterium]